MKKLAWVTLSVSAVCTLLIAGACLSQESQAEPFTIAWNYDTSGYMETCGCSAHQLGGLTRRATKLSELRAAGPVLAIEGQHIVSDKGDFNLFKGEIIVQALNSMHYDALALGVREAQLGEAGLKELTAKASFPCVASNLRLASGPWPTPSASVDIAGARVGIIAISDPAAADFELTDGITFSEPIAAANAAIEALGKVDLVIACLEGSNGWIEGTIPQLGRVGLFLTGDRAEGTATQDFQASPPRMNNFDRGRYLALITANPAEHSYDFAGSAFGLSDQLGDDPAIRGMIDTDFKPRLKEFFGVTKESLLQLFMPPSYCGDCHKKEYQVYLTMGHSHTLETLEKKNQTYNPDCMKCHINYDPKEDKLYSMTCVMCHSNITEDHVWQATLDPKSVVKPEKPVTTYTYDWCIKCHDPTNSVNFEEHWPQYAYKIYHGGDLSAAEAAAKQMGIDMKAAPPAHN